MYFITQGGICPGAGTAVKDPRSQKPACLKRGSEFIEIIGEGGSKHLQEGVAVGRRQKAVKVNEEEMQQHALMVYM